MQIEFLRRADGGDPWRSIKYEEVYLRAHDSVGQARQAIGRYLGWYNRDRRLSSLDGMTPDQAHFTNAT